MTLVFTSCQVKNSSSDDGLYSGHSPTGNNFSLVNPTSKVYGVNEKLTLNITFPFPIVADTTGGSPQLRLTVGATTRYATNVANADPKKLTFEYTFQSGDNDSNGIVINALELNGSTLKFDKDGVMTDCNVASMANKNLANVKVDTAGPTITAFSLKNTASPTTIWGIGKKLTFTMTFSEIVYVSGSVPEFNIGFDVGTGTAKYVSGPTSNVLTFEYTIDATVNDFNGYNSISALNIGAGTVKDAVGNNANLDFSALTAAVLTYSQGVKIGGQYPAVISTIFPANATYGAAEDLDFVFEFDRDVNVTGNPYLVLNVGNTTTTTREARYVPGPNPTKFVTFRYTTVPGDEDNTGITVPSSLNNDGGTATIRDDGAPNNNFFFDTNTNFYTVPVTTGIKLAAIQPKAMTLTRNADTSLSTTITPAYDNVWKIGQELLFTVGFNTPVKVDQTLGNPSLAFSIGGVTKQAPYLSGTNQANLIFKYTILEGDFDNSGSLTIGNLQLNGGNITDIPGTNILLTMPVTTLANTRVDGVRPILNNVTAPGNQVYSNVATFTRTELIFTANWNEPVHYDVAGRIAMSAGATSIPLDSYNNDVAAITHRPTADFVANITQTGLTVGTAITLATVTDLAGNQALAQTFTTPNAAGISIDTRIPTITSITPISATGTYKLGQSIDFSVTFSESVTITPSGNYPRIPMTVGAVTTKFMYAVASGTGLTHTFRYTVAAGENDTDGVSVTNTNMLHTGTGHARDVGRNNATTVPATLFANHKVDTTIPTIASTWKSPNGTYETGDELELRVTYSEIVNVDDAAGTPFITVMIGATNRQFNYTTGTGTTTLYFKYTLQNDDFDANGLPNSITTFSKNNAIIEDVAGNTAPNTLTGANIINMSAINVMFENVTVWFQTSATNKAKNPAGMTYSASGTSDNCGSPNNCRRMNTGSLNASLNGVQTLYLAIKTPAALSVINPTMDQNLMGSSIVLEEDTVAGNYTLAAPGASVTGATTLNLNDVYVFQFDYANESFNGLMMDSTFEGSLGEVIAVTGPLSSTQKDTIRTYLQGRFP